MSVDINVVDRGLGQPAASGSSGASAVAWSAVFAGAAAAAALSLILLILGVGLGLSSVSPWEMSGASATTIGIGTILWITFTQFAASGIGGYVAGRLRTRWAQLHTDEVFFRDTAHGFLAWSVATLVTAATLTSAVGSVLGAGAKAGATLAGAVETAAVGGAGATAAAVGAKSDDNGGPVDYFVDSLFRKSSNAGVAPASAPAPSRQTSTSGPVGASSSSQADNSTTSTAEVKRIFMTSVANGSLSQEDARQVGQIVAQRTGMSQEEAEKRATEVYARTQAKLKEAETKARAAADEARKATAKTALWMFVSLLLGAFIASFFATVGGRRRDTF